MFHELAHGGNGRHAWRSDTSIVWATHIESCCTYGIIWIFYTTPVVYSIWNRIYYWMGKTSSFNPNHLKYRRWGPALVAAAGPLINFVIAITCAIGYRIIIVSNPVSAFAGMLSMVVGYNISLAIFNLIPVPPLDGHHIIGAAFPVFKQWSDSLMERYRFLIMIILLIAFSSVIVPIVLLITRLLLGS